MFRGLVEERQVNDIDEGRENDIYAYAMPMESKSGLSGL